MLFLLGLEVASTDPNIIYSFVMLTLIDDTTKNMNQFSDAQSAFARLPEQEQTMLALNPLIQEFLQITKKRKAEAASSRSQASVLFSPASKRWEGETSSMICPRKYTHALV